MSRPLYEVVAELALDDPVLVVAMDGWVDAGFAAAAARSTLLAQVDMTLLATFDSERFIDYRARRPTMTVDQGMIAGLSWPSIELRAGRDRHGTSVAVLLGPEPDMAWRAFCDAVVELSTSLGVRLVATLGAFPAPAPHTRPVRLAATATDSQLAKAIGFVAGPPIELPAAIGSALEEAMAGAGIPAVGIWARVPHYAAGSPYPAAASALLAGLTQVTGLEVDASELEAEAVAVANRLDEAISHSEDHQTMLRHLELSLDAEEGAPPAGQGLPSGDEIAAELEKFLRGEL